VVAVIGDGALTGGLAYEGLNNAGIQKTNLLVILNDNNMAIDPNVGAMKEYLTDITTSKTYNRFKNDVWNILGKVEKIAPSARSYVQKLEHAVKSVILKQSNLFESIGFRYFGPVDGHDVVYLSKILNDLKDIEGPKLLHILTKKGKGYKFAEQNQTKFHAPGKFDRETGEILVVNSKKPAPPRYQDVFGETILELAQENDKLVGITPAMPTGSSLNIMMKQIPSRTYDVGIAEQHAVTFAAGMATQGLKPYCTIYSTFLQRAYDQIVHDVALQKLPVVFCIDRAGLVGADGPTHHGVFDISFLRHIPNIIISAPMNEAQMRDLMFTASLYSGGPFAIRYPRGKGVMSEWKNKMKEIPVGTGRQLSNGDDIAILSIGHPGNFVARAIKKLASDGINISHYDMRFVKPLDEQLLHKICKKYKHIVTVEDGTIIGGFGSAVIEFINKAGYHLPVTTLGIPDNFVGQASPEELYKECGIDSESIYRKVRTKIRPYVLFSAG
jgi:1-deoxy-D-xylulose-5-phosphate synthase